MKKSKQIVYLIIISATLLDILLLFNAFLYPVSNSFIFYVKSFDFMICIVLWAEFLYSYWNADDRRQYLRENYWSILGMLPIDFVFLRALRLIKLLQLVKIFVIARDSERWISEFLTKTILDKIILVIIIFVFVLTVLINFIDSEISDIGMALWYIIVSMTSTGYGDVVPATPSGKILGAVAMIGGILIFAAITAVISSLYVSKLNQANNEDLSSKIDELSAQVEELNKKIDELKKE